MSGLGSRVEGGGWRVEGLRVEGVGWRVSGLGLRVHPIAFSVGLRKKTAGRT